MKRIAMIGLGMAVKPHAQSLIDLSDRVTIAAAYSPTPARRAQFADSYGLPVVESVDAIFDDGSIDAVLILTPPNTHLELVQRAAASGKHILLEKPLEISTAKAEALVAAADTAGVTLGVVLQNRFRAGSLKLSETLAAGRLGTLIATSMRLHNWRPQSYYDEPGRGTLARDGGGVLLTQAIHPIDLLIAFAGLPAEVSAYATTSPVHRMETEDLVAAALRYENGALGTISATTAAYPGFAEEITIIGESGSATLSGGTLTARFSDSTSLEAAEPDSGSGTGADPMGFKHDHHKALITDFLDAIESGGIPKISGHDALKAHDLVDALLASASTGMPHKVQRR